MGITQSTEISLTEQQKIMNKIIDELRQKLDEETFNKKNKKYLSKDELSKIEINYDDIELCYNNEPFNYNSHHNILEREIKKIYCNYKKYDGNLLGRCGAFTIECWLSQEVYDKNIEFIKLVHTLVRDVIISRTYELTFIHKKELQNLKNQNISQHLVDNKEKYIVSRQILIDRYSKIYKEMISLLHQ